MIRFFSFVVLGLISAQSCRGQEMNVTLSSLLRGLYEPVGQQTVDERWSALTAANKIPVAVGDSVAFLYRGKVRSVAWVGDFNGWGNSKSFQNNGTRIPDTDIWILKSSLPGDARLDYKILIDERDLILDPSNPLYQWSGVGGGSLNSELRMPRWEHDPVTSDRLPGIATGSLSKDLLINSIELGYQVSYSVYTPAGYEAGKPYPVLYVTDGYEYMHERMGNMIAILDNLIHLHKMEPVIAVFIDHREPVNRTNNRRMQELGVNEKYMNFISRELIPVAEKTYSASGRQTDRAIVGTSLGGLSSAWFAFKSPDVFPLVGIQSPAFWYKKEIYTLVEDAGRVPVKVFMSTGLIHDTEDAVRKMGQILDRKGVAHTVRAVNQGHSWGNWRDLTDDMLIYLFPVSD